MRDSPGRLVQDTLLNLLGALLPMGITLVTVPIYLRLVGDARYGVLTLTWLLVGYFGLFDLGLGRATTNILAKLRDAPVEQRTTVFWSALTVNLALGLAGAFVLWVLARLWASQLFGVPSDLESEVHSALPYLALAVPLVTTSSVLTGALEAQGDFRRANSVALLGSILTAVLPLVAASLSQPRLDVLVASTVGGRAVAGLAGLWSCRRSGVFEGFRLGALPEIANLLRYGAWVTVSAAVGPLLTSLDRFAIASSLGASMVPYYTVPFALVTRVQVLASSLQRALFPRFSAQPQDPAKRVAREAIFSLAAVMTPVLVAVTLLLRPFLEIWIGPGYGQHAGPVGEILAAGIWVNSLAFIPYGLLQAQGRPDLTAKFHLLELGPYVVGLLLTLKYFGLKGAAAAWSARAFLDTLLLFLAAGLIRDVSQGLRTPTCLLAVSTVLALVLPNTLVPRVIAAVVLSAVSAVWALDTSRTRFVQVLKYASRRLGFSPPHK